MLVQIASTITTNSDWKSKSAVIGKVDSFVYTGLNLLYFSNEDRVLEDQSPKADYVDEVVEKSVKIEDPTSAN